MWIVQVALRRPYTFLVMALLILLATPLVLSKMSTDIFPEINIPVVSIVWNYAGLSAQEVGQRITAVNERSLTTTVNDIEHIESQSLSGIAVIKVFFQPTANIRHRRTGHEGRTAGGDHCAGDRRAAQSGQGRARSGRLERRPGEEHRGSLAKPSGKGRGHAAGIG
jgi:hypothetical protein